MQLNQFNNPLYILSAMNSYRSREANKMRHDQLMAHLRSQGVPFTEVDGQYKGRPEKSLIVIGDNRFIVQHYASVFNQESFLKLLPRGDNSYDAYFVRPYDGYEQHAGIFKSVPPQSIVNDQVDFTRDSNGTYFTITSEARKEA